VKTDDGSEAPSQRRNGPSAIYGNQMALPPLDSNCADGECVFAVSTFLGWSGNLNATTATTQLTMDGDKEIQAFD